MGLSTIFSTCCDGLLAYSNENVLTRNSENLSFVYSDKVPKPMFSRLLRFVEYKVNKISYKIHYIPRAWPNNSTVSYIGDCVNHRFTIAC